MLEQLASTKPDEPFPHYGLAMEYKRLDRLAEADATFAKLIERHPSYVPAYLMYGNLLEARDQRERAAEVYAQGIRVADEAGDEHARSELEAARGALT